MRTQKFLFFLGFISLIVCVKSECKRSITSFTSYGKKSGNVCSGQLIFEENFDTLDTRKWSHEVTLTGFGNGEFEYYLDDRRVSYAKGGNLHIKPRLLSSDKGDDFLSHGTLDLGKACTNADDSGCRRTGQPGKILNPIMSARLRTINSFSFKYGRFEARAKVSGGNWLWPAIWLLPKDWKYGGWPRSGEIDVLESRGNVDLGYPNNAASTLHWGPDAVHNMWSKTHWEKNNSSGFQNGFHLFQAEWDTNHISFSVDNKFIGEVVPPNGGFWEYGNLASSGQKNPWAGHSKMAPFDEEFYIIINLAIGSTNGFFPESPGKPWKNNIDRFVAMTQFWEGRGQWLNSWKMGSDFSDFEVDYVRVFAL